MLSVFVSALERTHIHEDKPPWSVLTSTRTSRPGAYSDTEWKNSGKTVENAVRQ